MFSGKFTFWLIVIMAAITALGFLFLEKKYSISISFITVSIMVFSFLIWLNDKHYSEEQSMRVFSISDKEFIHDVIVRQMNMHGITKVIETDDGMEFYKGKHKAGYLIFKKDENGNPLVVDGKYVIEVHAPEYILHNIDHELWSIIGQKQ